MMRRAQSGFSLLELMIVIAIITIIAALAVPNLLRARQQAYEASAAGFLHSVQADQISYRATHGTYASSFSQLPGFAAAAAASSPEQPGASSGASANNPTGPTSMILRDSYIYTLTRVNEEQWYVTAQPILDRYNGLYYRADETGNLRSSKGSPVDTSERSQ